MVLVFFLTLESSLKIWYWCSECRFFRDVLGVVARLHTQNICPVKCWRNIFQMMFQVFVDPYNSICNDESVVWFVTCSAKRAYHQLRSSPFRFFLSCLKHTTISRPVESLDHKTTQMKMHKMQHIGLMMTATLFDWNCKKDAFDSTQGLCSSSFRETQSKTLQRSRVLSHFNTMPPKVVWKNRWAPNERFMCNVYLKIINQKQNWNIYCSQNGRINVCQCRA